MVYLVLDTQSGDTAIRHGILQGLKDLGKDFESYSHQNIAITGTHSHSGPGAWLNYLLPQITSKGFDKQSYEAIVSGALLSIRRAHDALTPGHLFLASKEVEDANVNRSPYAYLANPEKEREQYKHNVDKHMTMLYFQRKIDDRSMGVLTWFPTHGTSMLGNNTLVSGDNKGVAAYLFEKSMEESSESATESFVAGFSQSNVGDTSPNVLGAYCEDGSGERCSFEASLCNGRNQHCHGRGPFFGLNDGGAKSCYEIGKRQYQAARDLFESIRGHQDQPVQIRGPVRSIHTFKHFSNYTFPHPNGSTVSTCPAALGYGFAAGTTDGHGAFDFKQNSSGSPDSSPLWTVARNFIHKPTEKQVACHAPKPILLDVGTAVKPYAWAPNIADVQVMRIGQLYIIVSPGEATTMSGRRWRQAVQTTVAETDSSLASDGGPHVVIGGPANSYAHYIATEEEYEVQRYEGASTLYGPHTLNAFINVTLGLLPYLSTEYPARQLPHHDHGPSPPINVNKSLSFINPVVFDSPGFFRSFGDIIGDVNPPSRRKYDIGDVVSATFVGANPRNDLRLEQTFASVHKVDAGSATSGAAVATDNDWDLTFTWRRTSELAGISEVTVSWEIPDKITPGEYCLGYHGNSKSLGSQDIKAFSGTSGRFAVS